MVYLIFRPITGLSRLEGSRMNLTMRTHHLLCLSLLMIGLLYAGACKPAENRTAPAVATATAATYFQIPLEDTRPHLQLALSQAELARGLMYRDHLEQDHGMLFVFDQPAPRAFWMRNTRIPLDLAYLDANGTVMEIHKLYPYSETTVPSRSQAIQFVIEMNRGWFEANQLGVGARLSLQHVTEAIVARGQNPSKFGL